MNNFPFSNTNVLTDGSLLKIITTNFRDNECRYWKNLIFYKQINFNHIRVRTLCYELKQTQ